MTWKNDSSTNFVPLKVKTSAQKETQSEWEVGSRGVGKVPCYNSNKLHVLSNPNCQHVFQEYNYGYKDTQVIRNDFH